MHGHGIRVGHAQSRSICLLLFVVFAVGLPLKVLREKRGFVTTVVLDDLVRHKLVRNEKEGERDGQQRQETVAHGNKPRQVVKVALLRVCHLRRNARQLRGKNA